MGNTGNSSIESGKIAERPAGRLIEEGEAFRELSAWPLAPPLAWT